MSTIKACLFDLDGVIVDTAVYHYQAWNRLAAEMGFDFTEHDNERLKGVSRMRSLEIILEIGGVTKTEAEKEEERQALVGKATFDALLERDRFYFLDERVDTPDGGRELGLKRGCVPGGFDDVGAAFKGDLLGGKIDFGLRSGVNGAVAAVFHNADN